MSKPIDKPSSNPIEVLVETSSSNLRLFSDELLEKFKGRMLELYLGDQAENLNFEETSVPQNATIFGRLIDVLDRFIIIDCYYVDKAGNVKNGNITYINTFQIRVMSELDGNGSLDDVFLNCKNATKVRKNILAHHNQYKK